MSHLVIASSQEYQNVLQSLHESKTNKSGETLIDLDEYFWHSLPLKLRSMKYAQLSKTELQKVMEWKLRRGKFRPALRALIASNSDELVKSVTLKAFSLLKQQESTTLEWILANRQSWKDIIGGCIDTLCKLRGVGPATATDETYSILCVLKSFDDPRRISGIKYTKKTFLDEFLTEMMRFSKENKTELDRNGMNTLSLIEKGIWAAFYKKVLALPQKSVKNSAGKRKA